MGIPVEIFKGSIKSIEEGTAKQVASANHPACTCPDLIQERGLLFEKLRMMSTKIHDVTMGEMTAEEKFECKRDEEMAKGLTN